MTDTNVLERKNVFCKWEVFSAHSQTVEWGLFPRTLIVIKLPACMAARFVIISICIQNYLFTKKNYAFDSFCQYVFCRKCLEGWHLGPCRSEGQSLPSAEDCSSGGYRAAGYFVSEDRAAAAQWGDPTRRAMRLSTKPCPNCRVPTERAGGCMHMDCTKCKFEWCWVCQTKWTRECMGNHWFG